MHVVQGYPPNIEEIARVLPRARTSGGVVFAHGDTIYVPDGPLVLPPEIQAHEEEHGRRQLVEGVEAWWDRYLSDLQFRLIEEIYGHQAEYRAVCARVTDRNARMKYLYHVADKLASPLYGGLVSQREALDLLR